MNIFDWLKSPKNKYLEGVKLYKQFKNDNYVQYFEQVQTSEPGEAHFDMLHKQLARLARIQGQKAAEVTVEAKDIKVAPVVITGKDTKETKNPVVTERDQKHIKIVEQFELLNPKDLPEDLQIVFFAIKERFGKMKELHNKIKQAKDGDDISDLTQEITNLEDENYIEWGKIDAWAKNLDPDKKKDDGRSVFHEFEENKRRIETVKINIPRAKKEIDQFNKQLKDKDITTKDLRSLKNKIKRREKNIPEWEKELTDLAKRQAEIKDSE